MPMFHNLSPKRAAGLLGAVTLIGVVSVADAGGTQGPWERASSVDGSVMINIPGDAWFYRFTVNNISNPDAEGESETEPVIVDWELPYFTDAGFTLADVVSPDGWLAAIETIGTANDATGWEGVASWQDPDDPYYFGPDSPFTSVTQVLHWYSECWVQDSIQPGSFDAAPSIDDRQCEISTQDAIFVGSSLDGFGFTADFSATDAPYQASWAELPVESGDPPFPLQLGFPASPLAIADAPAPATLLLVLVGGLAGLGLRRRS